MQNGRGLLSGAAPPRATDKNLDRLNVSFGRWGRLQTCVLYALMDGKGSARTYAIAAYCWDGALTRTRALSQARAARSIGARRLRREGREWVWACSLRLSD